MNLYVNLDFEYELMLGRRPETRAVRRQNQRWSHILRLMPGCENARPRDQSGDGEWLAWGVTPSFLALRPEGNFPDAECVRHVNSKVYSAALEESLGASLPGAQICESPEEIEEALANRSGDFFVKNPFGVAGRERIVAADARLSDDQAIWLERQFALVDAVVVEPRVDRIRDWSIQFELEESGARELGVCELITDAMGNHRGHRIAEEKPSRKMQLLARDAARRVYEQGYRGPLGIDAFEGRLDQALVERPLCEINARVTFGRLALELARFVPEREFEWRHPPAGEVSRATVSVDDADDVGVYRLPDFADPDGRSGTEIRLS